MAKTKIYELAKELNVSSKDVIGYLHEKGVEGKVAQSGIEDSMVSSVKNKFSTKPAQAPAQTSDASHGDAKKKKRIVIIGNPENSKTGMKMPPKKQEHAQKTVQTPVVKETQVAPEVKTTPVTPPPAPKHHVAGGVASSDGAQPVRRTLDDLKVTLPTPKPRVQQEAPKPAPTTYSSDRPNNGNRPQGGYNNNRNNDGQQRQGGYNNRNNDGQQRQGGYNNNRNNDGQQRQGGYNNNRPNDGNRPQGGYNNNRPYDANRPQGGYNNRNNDGQQRQGGYNNNRPNDGNRPQGGYNNRNNDGQQRQGGYNNNRPYDANRPQGGYNRPNDGSRPQGGYNRPNDGSRPQGGYNRPNDGSRPQGGYNRPNDGSRPQGGYNRSNDGNRPQGGYNNNRPGGYRNDSGRQTFDKDKDLDRQARPGQGFKKPVSSKPASFDGGKGMDKKREEDKRRMAQERDKKNKKDYMYVEDGDVAKNKNRAGRFIKPEKKEEVVEEAIKVIQISEMVTIKDLADKMRMQPSVIIKKLFLQGKIVTVNHEVTYEEAEEIAMEYEILCEKEVKVDVIEELLKEEDEVAENLEKRPPVICVMGHVDHGKTSLLDAIRKTNVTDREAGGITQHIGAYTVTTGNGEKITFLDTPGHEAFTSMRMRGANATDIAILVVAADDGVMPQTIEAINHAKAAGIEIIVAVNKIDKPGANIERVKQELTEYELIAEDWGGSTVFCPVSAKQGDGIEDLLDMILLTADVLELKANTNRQARGVVIEAQLDKGRGPVATVLVQKGTLKVGDFISAGACYGKVRAMIDDKGRRVKEATPSTPVEILGLSDVPGAGEVFISHDSDKVAKNYADTYMTQYKEKMLEETKKRMSLDDLFGQIQAGSLKELNIIVKADVQGSVEAVKQSLGKLANEEVVVKCIHGGVGLINESDVILASASNAIIIGFNSRPDVTAKNTAEREGVEIKLYKVIYQAIEDVQRAMKGMLAPVYEEKVIAHAEVRQIFKASAIGNIAGSYVLDGTFQRGCMVRITREGKQVFEGDLKSLKRFKDDVKEVRSGYECGLVFEDYDQMQELDIVEAYIMVEVPR